MIGHHHLEEGPIIFSRPLPFVDSFVEAIDACLREHSPSSRGLSTIQRGWLKFCLMGVMVTNSVCWARFQRAGLGDYESPALSWVFRKSKIPWDLLFYASICVVVRLHGILGGVLVLDDSEKKRSKSTKRIPRVHKVKDKSSGGYFQGQGLVFLILVTDTITVPVGFEFYQPDPAISSWKKKDKALRKLGTPKAQRPPEPARNPDYPTKWELALRLLKRFRDSHTTVSVQAVLADALYGNGKFMDTASAVFGSVQVISQLRNVQMVRLQGRTLSVKEYFARSKGVSRTLRVRGGKNVSIIFNSARLFVSAHGTKRFVVAIKYDDELEYRYLVASDMSWRTEDILRAYTCRWLIEVFLQDWKGHEGFGALTKQPDEEGSSQSLILSLLVDHCLLLQPDQLAQLKRKQPAFTVGSLINRVKVDGLMTVFQELFASDDPQKEIEKLAEILTKQFTLMPSKKHMVAEILGDWSHPHLSCTE